MLAEVAGEEEVLAVAEEINLTREQINKSRIFFYYKAASCIFAVVAVELAYIIIVFLILLM